LLRGLVTRAGGSALLCSPTGLGALGCAAIGAGVWLTTDYAMLKLEQQQQGKQMEQSLSAMLEQQEQLMRKALLYDPDRWCPKAVSFKSISDEAAIVFWLIV